MDIDSDCRSLRHLRLAVVASSIVLHQAEVDLNVPHGPSVVFAVGVSFGCISHPASLSRTSMGREAEEFHDLCVSHLVFNTMTWYMESGEVEVKSE